MVKNIEELKMLKDELHTIYTNDNDKDDIHQLLKIKKIGDGIDEDLFEALILIHSNRVSEMQALRLHQFKTLTKLIDNNIIVYGNIEDKIEKIFIEKKKTVNKNSFFRVMILWSILAGIGLFIFVLWYMFKEDPVAGENATGFFKTILKDIFNFSNG